MVQIRGRERPVERLATSAITVYNVKLVFEKIVNIIGVLMAERAFIDNHHRLQTCGAAL